MNYFALGVTMGAIATICEMDMVGKSNISEKIKNAAGKLKIHRAITLADVRQYLAAHVEGLTEETRFRLLTVLDGAEEQAAGHVPVHPM